MTMCYVKGTANTNKPTENYPPTLQLYVWSLFSSLCYLIVLAFEIYCVIQSEHSHQPPNILVKNEYSQLLDLLNQWLRKCHNFGKKSYVLYVIQTILKYNSFVCVLPSLCNTSISMFLSLVQQIKQPGQATRGHTVLSSWSIKGFFEFQRSICHHSCSRHDRAEWVMELLTVQIVH